MWQQLLLDEVAVVSSWGWAVWARPRSLALLAWGEHWRDGGSQEVCRKAERAKPVRAGKADGETHSNKLLPCQ